MEDKSCTAGTQAPFDDHLQEFKVGQFRFAVGPSAHGVVPRVHLAEDSHEDFRERGRYSSWRLLAGGCK